MAYTDNKVKVTVVESHCPKYKEGDVIRFVGSDIDKENKGRTNDRSYSTINLQYGSYSCNGNKPCR